MYVYTQCLFLFLPACGTGETYYDRRFWARNGFFSGKDVFLVNLDFSAERERKREGERSGYAFFFPRFSFRSASLLRLRSLKPISAYSRGLSSPPRNKQGNKIQVLRILPFPACSLRVFLLLSTASRELVRAFFPPLFPFARFLSSRVLFPRRVGIGFHQLVERFITRPPYHKHRTV